MKREPILNLIRSIWDALTNPLTTTGGLAIKERLTDVRDLITDWNKGADQMKTWHVYLRGEDHTEFTIEVQAKSLNAARDEAEDRYPEATVLEVFDPEERARDIYERAQRDYDNDYYYDD